VAERQGCSGARALRGARRARMRSGEESQWRRSRPTAVPHPADGTGGVCRPFPPEPTNPTVPLCAGVGGEATRVWLVDLRLRCPGRLTAARVMACDAGRERGEASRANIWAGEIRQASCQGSWCSAEDCGPSMASLSFHDALVVRPLCCSSLSAARWVVCECRSIDRLAAAPFRSSRPVDGGLQLAAQGHYRVFQEAAAD
jgi:hypothetical protein